MNNTLSQKIKYARKKNKITQTELSKRTNLSRNTIVNFETGKRNPRVRDLQKIANALNVSIEELI